MSVFALLAVLVRGSIAIGGSATCPAPSDVQAAALRDTPADSRLDSDWLEPGRPETVPLDIERVEIAQVGAAVVIRLLDRRGELLAERQLASGPSCESLASAASAIIRVMELEVSTRSGVEVIALPPRETATPARTLEVSHAIPPSIRKKRASLDVGAGLLASLSGDGTTMAGVVTLGLRLPFTGFRPESGVFLAGPRSVSLPNGTASYQRFWLSLGAGYQFAWGRLIFEPQLAALEGLLEIRGDGRTSSTRAAAFATGAGAGLILHWSFGKSAVWGGPFCSWWSGPTTVQIGASGQEHELPQVEVLLGVGLRFAGG